MYGLGGGAVQCSGKSGGGGGGVEGKVKYTVALFTNPIWSRPNLYRTMVWTKLGFVNGTQNLVRT